MSFVKATLIVAGLLLGLPSDGFADDALRLEVASARIVHRSNLSFSAIQIQLSERSRAEFGRWTERYVGRIVRISVDGDIVSEPRLQEPIAGGMIEMSGLHPSDIENTAARLANRQSTVTVDVKPE